jgi:hypothetical protein
MKVKTLEMELKRLTNILTTEKIMKKILSIATFVITLFVLSATSQAALISVSGPTSNVGSLASIIGAPADVNDDVAYNTAQQGFNEVQDYILTSALSVDGGSIAAGTRIDSHMIFLNSGPGNNGTLITQFNVDWTFDGMILGVMSDRNGNLEVASSEDLGASGTLYPLAGFGARGLEMTAGCNVTTATNDCYGILDNVLSLTMRVSEPGDWIRVITADVPEPSIIALFGIGLFGIGLMRRKA